MVLIPVILFFSMVDNFFLIKKFHKKIDFITCFQKDKVESDYYNSLCGTYLKVYKNFFKNISGLAAWNVFSLFYILYNYDTFETGLKDYFYFPFKVFQTIMNQETFNKIYVFKTEGLSMMFIVILTIIFFYAGKYIGIYIANKALSKKKLSLRPNSI